MAFWKGLQTKTAHAPVVNKSDLQARWVQQFGTPAPDEFTWSLHHTLEPDAYLHTTRFYSENATAEDGCDAFLVSSHHLMITIDSRCMDEFEFVEFTVQIPTHAYVQFDTGPHVPLTHHGDGRFGLMTRFSIPRYPAASIYCILHFDFAVPCAHTNGRFASPIGMQWTMLGVKAGYDDRQIRIIPIYTGHDRDNESTAFMCVSRNQIQTRNKIDTLKWIASNHMKTHSHIIDKYAMVLQRRWRKRHMARQVYENTNLPRDMCWIVGAYASGGMT
jgi:hypothetical protein